MIVVGLTGGIGSGKSTVARLLARRGAVIIDADAIVHELQQPGAPLLDELAERFGDEIITADGALDRAKLADACRSPTTHAVKRPQRHRPSGGAQRDRPPGRRPTPAPTTSSCSTSR